MADLVPGVSYEAFVSATGSCRTEDEFRRSPFFREHGAALEALLRTPRGVESGSPAPPASPPRDSLTVVHWNIEKGLQLDRIVRRLADDPGLASADLWCFNEVDDGMARSGNRDVALEIARALGAGGWFLPNYIECTKGLPAERNAPGENRLGLHGIAILSRHPLPEVTTHTLPSAWDYFDYSEKRFGGRTALRVTVPLGTGAVDVVSVHLEMRSPPPGRTRQVAALVEALDSSIARPTLITGDLNTHTFSRGQRGDTLRGFLRIVGTPHERLAGELLVPERREGLFRVGAKANFRYEGFNDRLPTAWQNLGEVEDLRFLPTSVGRMLLRMFSLEGRRLPLRLDWMLGRGLVPLEARTLSAEVAGEGKASDHEPILVRVGLPRE